MAEDQAPETPAAPRKRRRPLRIAAIGMIGLIALVAVAPWIAGLPVFRGWLVGSINTAVAPGRVRVGELSLSWTQPLRLSGLSLADPAGKPVLTIASLQTDRGLLAFLRDRSDVGTITIEGAYLDAERKADGALDLIEALGPLSRTKGGARGGAGGTPPSLNVVLKRSTVRFQGPELASPFEARDVSAEVRVVRGRPVAVKASLANAGQTIDVDALIDPNSSVSDLTATLTATDWPIALRQAGVVVRARSQGTITARRQGGLWDFATDVALTSIVAEGPALAGDRPQLDRVTARGQARQTQSGWDVRDLQVLTPVGSLKAGGTLPATAGTPSFVEGTLDLAALAKLAPRAMRLREGLTLDRGQVRLHANLSLRDGAEHLDALVDVADLGATEDGRAIALHDPAKLEAHVVRQGDSVTVRSLTLRAAGLDATAQGDLETGVKLTGQVDLKALQAELGELLDLSGVTMSGRGGLAADYRRAGDDYQARFAAEFADLRIAGLTSEPFTRERVRLDASAVGVPSHSGLPTNWRTAHLAFKTGDILADVKASDQKGTIALAVDASAAVSQPTAGKLQARAALRWKGRSATIDDCRAGLVPDNPRAGGQTLALAVQGTLDLDKGELDLKPVAGLPLGAVGIASDGLKVRGLGRADVPLKADAALVGDLAALDRLVAAWSESSLAGYGGTYGARLQVERQPDQTIAFGARLDVRQLMTPEKRGPVSLVVTGDYGPQADQLRLPSVELTSAFAHVRARATIADVSNQRIAELAAQLDPRWEGLDGLLADALGPNGRVRAAVRPIELRGPLAGGTVSEVLRGLEGTIALDLSVAQAYGVTVGPTPIVLRLAGGRAVFDTIQTTINDGPAVIGADLALDDPNALWLRLAPGSKVEHARINEVVSSALLAYVAPVLSEATEVDGTLRVAIRQAAFPLVGPGSTSIDGDVVFENVVFEPGPGAGEILALAGQKVPKLALNQPIQLQVAEGRVHQRGLKVPVNRETQIALAGSVGFDKTLSLRATMPLNGRMLGRDDLVQQLLSGTQITVPIGGTLSRPGIDRQALQATLRQAMRQVARRGLEAGAGRLLERALGNVAGDEKPAPESGSLGRDAKRILEGLGREIFEPKRP